MTPPARPGDEAGYRPSIARIRDCWLGGTHHGERDGLAAERILVCAPQLPYLVHQQRAMQQRMVRYLIAKGVRQFLDLDAGVPAGGGVHEVAMSLLPDARVVYADADPLIVRDGRELLAGAEHVGYLHAEAGRADQVLAAPELCRLIDLDEPVAVMMIDTLLHVPDENDPAGLVAGYTGAVCSGSYLGLSQFSQTPELVNGLALFTQMYAKPPPIPLREPEQFARLFAGLELVQPGIVPVALWHPELGEEPASDPERIRVYAGRPKSLIPSRQAGPLVTRTASRTMSSSRRVDTGRPEPTAALAKAGSSGRHQAIISR